MSVNDQILNDIIKRSVYLERFKNSVTREIAIKSQASLRRSVGQIIRNIEGTQAQKLATKSEIFQTIKNTREQVEARLDETLKDFSQSETRFNVKVLNDTIPTPIIEQINVKTVDQSQLWGVIKSRPFQGALMSEHMDKWEATTKEKMWGTIQQGIIDGEPTPNIVRNVLEGGINGNPLEISKRNLEAIVRTSIAHTAEETRRTVYNANDDLIKGEKWVSTLDARTTPICITMDGATRELGEKEWSNGQHGEPGTIHWQCRSVSIPLTKSWRELGFDIDELSPSTRASMDGQVPAELKYTDWLAKQSKATLEDVLGKTRAEMFLSGEEKITGFFQDGKLLTLAELDSK